MKENTLNKISNSVGLIYRYIKLLIICSLLILISCKARKHMVTNRASGNIVNPTDNKRVKLDAIRAGQTNFNTFSGKAHTTLDFSGNSNDVTLNIRIKRDQKIWVSVTAIAGIEAARALITPDSIMIINRLQSLYIKQPFSYIYKFAGKEINYKTLESLLTGNAIPELVNENADLQTKGDTITLMGNLQDLMYKLVIGPGMKVTQTNLSNQTTGQALQVINNTFLQTDNRIIPSQIDITSVVKDKKILVNLHYIKIEFDQPLEYPFNIPARYTEAN
ncbi:MAG: hypothetical protein JWQ63_1998 [Mucilaginibacter sp.]|nr:hypothetical protein [Mucilaginibacter sp.]